MNAVFFGASWCYPCKRTYPLFVKVVGEDAEYVDVESFDWRADDVTSVPTIRVYDENDLVVREHRGAATEDQIRQLVSDD